MRTLLILSIVFISFTSNAVAQKQGICGKVTWISGNQMPGPGLKSSSAKGIVREVYIYESTTNAQTVQENGFYTSIQTKLVKRVKTKKDGSFSVNLPVGTYSVLIKEAPGLWANSFDGQGQINPITVEANTYMTLTINVNYQAAY